MIQPILLSLLLLMAGPNEPASSLKGTWQGTLVRDAGTNTLTLIIDDVSSGAIHGRLLNNGSEYAPLSEGTLEGKKLTFRADTLQFVAHLAGDALDATLTIAHGRQFPVTFHRIGDAVPPPPSSPTPSASSGLTPMKPGEIPTSRRSAGAAGTLLLMGGGVNAPAIMQRFSELAKGGLVVVIPSALDDRDLGPGRLEFLAKRHAAIFHASDVVVLHTRDRATADSEEFVKPLRRASAVWIMGGEEAYLLKAYQGTRTETAMRDLLARGGVVGGTSAGALVQLAAVPAEDGKSAVRGFGFLLGVVVWPHWSERHAEAALEKVAREFHLLGIGIDEATAIVVHGDQFEVIGDGHVGIIDGARNDAKRYELLSSGQRFKMGK